MLKLTIFLLAVGLASAGILQETLEEGPACPIDDPLIVEVGKINVTLPPFLIIDDGSMQYGAVAVGLSTLWYKYTINLLTLRIDFEATLSGACIEGDSYSATGVIDAAPFRQETIPSGPFTGLGGFKGCVTEFRVAGHAILLVNLITNRMSMRVLVINDFSFATLEANLGTFTISGDLINWTEWNSNIKANFEADWTQHQLAIVEKLRLSVNEELKKYTLGELLDLIGSGQTSGPCPTTPASMK